MFDLHLHHCTWHISKLDLGRGSLACPATAAESSGGMARYAKHRWPFRGAHPSTGTAAGAATGAASVGGDPYPMLVQACRMKLSNGSVSDAECREVLLSCRHEVMTYRCRVGRGP